MPTRFCLTASPDRVARTFGLALLDPFPPRYNIAPTQPVLVVRAGETYEIERGRRRVAFLARWGLIPGWAEDPATLPLLFNARAETAGERASFRGALRHRRALVPASGFYAWRRSEADGRRPQPFFVRPRTDEPLAFAALWEPFLAADGSEIDTAAILTVPAGSALDSVTERMPAVIAPADFDHWLDCRENAPATVAGLLRPAPENLFEAQAVSHRVDAVANMGPDVQEPIDPSSSFGGET